MRLVADDRGHLRPDPLQRAPGRGVYVCAASACVEAACRRGAWARGLRRGVARVESSRLIGSLEEALSEKVLELVRTGLADGRLVAAPRDEDGGTLVLEGEGAVQAVNQRLGRLLAALLGQRCQLRGG